MKTIWEWISTKSRYIKVSFELVYDLDMFPSLDITMDARLHNWNRDSEHNALLVFPLTARTSVYVSDLDDQNYEETIVDILDRMYNDLLERFFNKNK